MSEVRLFPRLPRRLLPALATAATLVLSHAGAHAELRYQVQDLTFDGPLFADEGLSLSALNNRGDVVGDVQRRGEEFSTVLTAVLSSGTKLRPLPGSGAFYESKVSDINDRGQILGEYRRSSSDPGHALYLYADGAWRDLGAGTSYGNRALALNAAGHVVGRADSQAFVFDGTQLRTIDIPGALGSYAAAINDSDVVAGKVTLDTPRGMRERVFVQDQDGLRLLPDAIAGVNDVQVAGIDASGRVAVWVYDNTRSFSSYLYGSDGRATAMGHLGDGSGNGTSVSAINAQGWAVGRSHTHCDSFANCDEAFLFRNGRMLNVNDLLDPADQATGWRIGSATDINDRGQIVGTAYRDGLFHTVLLTPVPEPAHAALLLAGLGVVAGVARRRCAGVEGAA